MAVSIVGILINSFSQPPLCGRIPTKSLVKPFNMVTFCYRQLSYSYHFDLTVFRKLSGPSNRLVLFFFFFSDRARNVEMGEMFTRYGRCKGKLT